MFHVGQLVVCIDDTPANWYRNGKITESSNLLEKGCIYTIRKLGTYLFADGHHPSIWLEEVIRSTPGCADHPYGLKRFRPVQKTDISIFTAMLNPTTIKEDA